MKQVWKRTNTQESTLGPIKKNFKNRGLNLWPCRLFAWFSSKDLSSLLLFCFWGRGRKEGCSPSPSSSFSVPGGCPAEGEVHSHSCREAWFPPGTGYNSFPSNTRFLSVTPNTGQARRQVTVLSCHLPPKTLQQTKCKCSVCVSLGLSDGASC